MLTFVDLLLTSLTRAVSPVWVVFTEMREFTECSNKPWELGEDLTDSAISPNAMIREIPPPPTSHPRSFQPGKVQGDLVTHSTKPSCERHPTRTLLQEQKEAWKREQGFCQ